MAITSGPSANMMCEPNSAFWHSDSKVDRPCVHFLLLL